MPVLPKGEIKQLAFSSQRLTSVISQTFVSLHAYTVHQMFHESKKKSDGDVFGAESIKPEKRKTDVICELCGKTYTTIG